jgi:hypothetical protein
MTFDLQAIRKRAEATSTPFWCVKYGLGEGAEVVTGVSFSSIGIATTQFTADAEFIAHARQDVPALIAEVERLRKIAHKLNEDLFEANDRLIWEFSGEIEKHSAKNTQEHERIKNEINGVE